MRRFVGAVVVTIAVTFAVAVLPTSSALGASEATARADVAVSVLMAPNPVPSDQVYVTTFRVTNRGPSSAAGVVLRGAINGRRTDGQALPRNTEIGWEGEIRCAGVSGAFRCNLGSLARGRSTSVRIRYRAADAGTRTAAASVTSRTRDARPRNNRATRTIRVVAGPGSRENPYPPGQEVQLHGGWLATVIGVTPNATAAVLAENMFNDPPAPGHQFFIARVRGRFVGSGSGRFDATFRFRALGPSAVSYSTFNNSCGVIPDRIEDPEVFTGGIIEGNICWQVRSSDAAALSMYDDPLLGDDADRRWFRLTP